MLAAAEKARQIKSRIWNPVNGHHSSELDIVTEPELRRRRIDQIKQAEAHRKEKQWSAIFDRLRIEAEARAADLAQRELEERERGILSIETIQRVVCSWYSINLASLVSERRTLDVVYPRQVAMYLCRHHSTASLPRIGKRFGGRDHTTAIHAVNKIGKLVEDGDVETVVDIVRLRRILGVS